MFASLRTLAVGTLSASIALAAPLQSAVSAEQPGAYHMYQTPAQMARSGRVPAMPAGGSMEYFAGSVFSNVKVVSVIWGNNVNTQTVANIGGFLSAIVNSNYVDQLSVYDTNIKGVNGKQGTNQTIARGTYFGQVQITPKHKKLTLTDAMIKAELKYQISKGVLPLNDLNTLYMIYFPADVTISLGGALSCQSFGAYHEAVSAKMTASNIFYGVMPDCGGGFQYMTLVSSHEFAEATTDNIPTPGSNPKYPQAWNTSNGYEIGDLCEGTSATLTAGKNNYTVQEVYLNNLANCGTGNFTSP